MKAKLCGICVIGASIWLSGCATPTQSSGMVPAAVTPAAKHAKSVSVAVSGGSETSALGTSKISDADFAAALREAITKSGVFAGISPGTDADYRLDVQIVRLAQPLMGGAFTVTMETTWSLRKRGEETPFWQKAITGNHTVKISESLVGVTRLRLATEGAARSVIQDGIGQFGGLSLR